MFARKSPGGWGMLSTVHVSMCGTSRLAVLLGDDIVNSRVPCIRQFDGYT